MSKPAPRADYIGAGRRRHSVTVWRRSLTGSGIEQTVVYTADASPRWAAIEPVSVKALFAKEGLVKEDATIYSETSHFLTMQYTCTPAAPGQADVIVFGTQTFTAGKWTGTGRVFEILGKPRNRDEMNRELVFMCAERT